VVLAIVIALIIFLGPGRCRLTPPNALWLSGCRAQAQPWAATTSRTRTPGHTK